MGRRPADHPLIRAGLGLLLSATLLLGCAAPLSPSASPKAVPDLAGALSAALQSHNAEAFAEVFTDPGLARRWYSLLVQGRATFTATGSADRVQVHSRFVGDQRAAVETLTLTRDSAGRITGLAAGPAPVWALEQLGVTTVDGSTVLAAAGVQAPLGWSALLREARNVVRSSALIAGHPSGAVVIEAPALGSTFTAATGGSAADTAAVTSCTSGTPRIILNPAALQRDRRWLRATLIHESVHVATDSACAHGPSWLVEGMAEAVAAASDPVTAQGNAALVRSYLGSHPMPRTLPQVVESPTDYALAQLAADQIATRLGGKAADFFSRGVAGRLSNAELRRASTWYLAELAKRHRPH